MVFFNTTIQTQSNEFPAPAVCRYEGFRIKRCFLVAALPPPLKDIARGLIWQHEWRTSTEPPREGHHLPNIVEI